MHRSVRLTIFWHIVVLFYHDNVTGRNHISISSFYQLITLWCVYPYFPLPWLISQMDCYTATQRILQCSQVYNGYNHQHVAYAIGRVVHILLHSYLFTILRLYSKSAKDLNRTPGPTACLMFGKGCGMEKKSPWLLPGQPWSCSHPIYVTGRVPQAVRNIFLRVNFTHHRESYRVPECDLLPHGGTKNGTLFYYLKAFYSMHKCWRSGTTAWLTIRH